MKGYDFGVGCNNWVEGTSGIRSQLSSLMIWAPIRNWWSLNFRKSDSEVVNPCRTPAKSPNIRRQNQILSLIVQVGNYDCTKFSTNWRSKNVKPVWGPMSQGQHGTPRFPGGECDVKPTNKWHIPWKCNPTCWDPLVDAVKWKAQTKRSCCEKVTGCFFYECMKRNQTETQRRSKSSLSQNVSGKQRSESTL